MITMFRYYPNGVCEELQDTNSLKSPPQNGESLWLDLETPTAEESEVLSRVFNFHPLAVEDCWHEPQAPKADDYGNYLFMVVHGVRYDAATEAFTTHELNIFLGPNYLVTFHLVQSRSIE